jgi:uncharacterized protein (UPF0276 family)
MSDSVEEWRVVVKWARCSGPHYVRDLLGVPITEQSARGYARGVRDVHDVHVEWVRVERRTVTPWEEA